jgi:hypothetical protein
MKKLIILILTLPTMSNGLREKSEEKRSRFEGTWERVGGLPDKLRQIKVINETHFTWVIYDGEEKLALAVGGGTFIAAGDTYKELFQFGSEGIAHDLVGKEQVFMVKLNDDTWHVSGTLSNGIRIEETWKRLK